MTCSPGRPTFSLPENYNVTKCDTLNKKMTNSNTLTLDRGSSSSLKPCIKSTPPCPSALRSKPLQMRDDKPTVACDKPTVSPERNNGSNKNRGIRLTVLGNGDVALEVPGDDHGTDGGQRSAIRITSDKAISINIDGNGATEGIHIHSQGAIDLCLGSTTGNNNVKASKDVYDNLDEDDDIDQSIKGHRRNNSAHIMVVGPGKNKNETLTTFEKDQDMYDDTFKDSTCEKDTLIDDKMTLSSKSIDMSKYEMLYENTSVKTAVDEYDNTQHEVEQMCSKLEKLAKDRKCLPSYSSDRINLGDKIKSTFTYLLQDIRLIPLCDHLYQNDVIDIDTYQTLYEGTKHGQMTQTDGVRQLLMHLSCVSVKQTLFRKSLYESNHEDIIPLLLPT